MEQEINNSKYAFSERLCSAIRATGSYAKTVAIIMIVGISISFLVSLTAVLFLDRLFPLIRSFIFPFEIIFLAICIITIWANVHLIKYANKAMKLDSMSDNLTETEIATNLSKYFKLSGIIVIVGFALVIVMLLVAVLTLI